MSIKDSLQSFRKNATLCTSRCNVNKVRACVRACVRMAGFIFDPAGYFVSNISASRSCLGINKLIQPKMQPIYDPIDQQLRLLDMSILLIMHKCGLSAQSMTQHSKLSKTNSRNRFPKLSRHAVWRLKRVFLQEDVQLRKLPLQ